MKEITFDYSIWCNYCRVVIINLPESHLPLRLFGEMVMKGVQSMLVVMAGDSAETGEAADDETVESWKIWWL